MTNSLRLVVDDRRWVSTLHLVVQLLSLFVAALAAEGGEAPVVVLAFCMSYLAWRAKCSTARLALSVIAAVLMLYSALMLMMAWEPLGERHGVAMAVVLILDIVTLGVVGKLMWGPPNLTLNFLGAVTLPALPIYFAVVSFMTSAIFGLMLTSFAITGYFVRADGRSGRLLLTTLQLALCAVLFFQAHANVAASIVALTALSPLLGELMRPPLRVA